MGSSTFSGNDPWHSKSGNLFCIFTLLHFLPFCQILKFRLSNSNNKRFVFLFFLFKISNQDVKLSLSDSVSGTPVCRGKYQGTARIVTRLSDAKLIQQGDVLITISTDIGWSPYFPLLGGVVTELGQYYDVFLINDL